MIWVMRGEAVLRGEDLLGEGPEAEPWGHEAALLVVEVESPAAPPQWQPLSLVLCHKVLLAERICIHHGRQPGCVSRRRRLLPVRPKRRRSLSIRCLTDVWLVISVDSSPGGMFAKERLEKMAKGRGSCPCLSVCVSAPLRKP